MINRLLSNLPFNPGLINQVAFYGKRLKQETSVRRLGFLFMALTLFVQMFAVIAPPAPSVDASSNDIIPGGFRGHAEVVDACRSNRYNYKNLLEYYGISCDDIANATERKIDYAEQGGQLQTMGREQKNKIGEKMKQIPGFGTVYTRPLQSWGDHCYNDGANCMGIAGNSSRGFFMILFSCGNLVFIDTPPPAPTKTIICSLLLISQPPGSRVPLGTTIALRGVSTGQALPPNEKVTFTYDYIDVDTGQIVSTSPGSTVTFPNGGGAVVKDSKDQIFKMNKPGHYRFRLAVGYDNNTRLAGGSMTGECARDIYVNTPPPKCPYNPNIPVDSPQCKACPDSEKPEDLSKCIILTKKATNITQGIADANGTIAQAGDTITYTLSTQNTSKKVYKKYIVEENISDILEYADVIDYHDGVKDGNNNVRWPATDIPAQGSIDKKLTIKIKSPIPQTPTAPSDPGSFDLKLTNTYGTTVEINLPGGPVKTTEQVTGALPNTGPGESLVIGFFVVAIIGYFFARSRLFAKELDVVRQEYGAGS